MPLVQIIPYVADQFDPGIYVFDGGTFGSENVFVDNPNRAFHVLKNVTFNASDILKGNFGHLGFYVFDKAEVRIDSIFKSRGIIYLTGVNWQIGYANEVVSKIVPEETVWQIGYANVNADTTVFSNVVSEEVQNKVDQSPSIPQILDSRTSVSRFALPNIGLGLSSVLETIGSVELVHEAASLEPSSPATFLTMGSFVTEAPATSMPSDGPMFANQRENRTTVLTNEIINIISVVPKTNESVSNTVQFTM